MRDLKRYALVVALAAAWMFPATSFAQAIDDNSPAGAGASAESEEGDEETDTGEKSYEETKNWSISGTVLSRIGQGTFADLENETNTKGEFAPNGTAFDRGLLLYVLAPSYTLGDFSMSSEIVWTHWLTQGGGLNEPGEFRFQDMTLYGNWAGHTFEPIGLNLSAEVALTFPTSKMSQAASTILGTNASVSLSKTFFENITLQYTLGGGKTFHKYTSPRVELDTVGETNALFRQGESEDLGNGLVAVGGLNTSWSMTNGLALQVSIIEDLSATVSYSLTKYWTYKINNNDEFHAENADVGRGQADLSLASVNLAYAINDYLSVTGGIRTQQPPKTSDNESLRFPFWNTQGAANNFSVIQLGVTGSY